GGIQNGQNVLGGDGVGVVEFLERAPVGADGVATVVERGQHLVEVGSRLSDPVALAAHRLGHRGQHRIELGQIDHLDEVDDVFEDGVDLCADICRLQHRSGCQPLFAGLFRIDQFDEFGAECGGDIDSRFDVCRDVLDLVGVYLELQAGAVGGCADV